MLKFEVNEYNFAPCGLTRIDATKQRGVVALRRIRRGELIALFPGPETFRIPARGTLPMAQWEDRHDADEVLIDEAQEMMPVSDYAIVTALLDADGYHYAVLDPMADVEAHSDEMQGLLDAFVASRVHDAASPPVVPDAMLALIEAKVELLHARLLPPQADGRGSGSGLRVLTRAAPPPDAAPFEVFLDARGGGSARGVTHPSKRMLVLHLPSGVLYPLCPVRLVARHAEHVKARLRKALLSTFDAKHEWRLGVRDRAKALALPDRYPYLAPFLNEPYARTEQANAEFVDPHVWRARLARQRAAPVAHPSHFAALLRMAAQKEEAPSLAERGYLQRPAVVATRDIEAGEEILVHYARDDEGPLPQERAAAAAAAAGPRMPKRPSASTASSTAVTAVPRWS